MKHSEPIRICKTGNQFFTVYGPFRCSSWKETIVGAILLMIGIGCLIVLEAISEMVTP